MTAPRDPDRLIHGFLLEGEEYLQDQVYDEVRAAIEHKRQRAFFGPWRTPIMNKLLTYGLGAAAVVVLLFAGSQFFGSPSGGTGAEPTPTATPEATLEPTPSPHTRTYSAAVEPDFHLDAAWVFGVVSRGMDRSSGDRALDR